MALKPTIYKCKMVLSDLDRNYYQTLQLTVAQHPSETLERMMVRVLVYAINADERLRFTKGLSTSDEPDIWLHGMDEAIEQWIDIGEPSVERAKKASRMAPLVQIYCFNSKSSVWWRQSEPQLRQLPINVVQFAWQEVQQLATLAQRTMDLSVTISGNSAYIVTDGAECEVSWVVLHST